MGRFDPLFVPPPVGWLPLRLEQLEQMAAAVRSPISGLKGCHVFVRFVVLTRDVDSGRRQGVFPTAYRLRRSGELSAELHKELDSVLGWCNDHLKIPDRFSRGNRKHANGMAIGWLKASAHECIAQLQRICRVLAEQGIATEMLSTARPGYIVYEDEYQVAAVPFADTPT